MNLIKRIKEQNDIDSQDRVREESLESINDGDDEDGKRNRNHRLMSNKFKTSNQISERSIHVDDSSIIVKNRN